MNAQYNASPWVQYAMVAIFLKLLDGDAEHRHSVLWGLTAIQACALY